MRTTPGMLGLLIFGTAALAPAGGDPTPTTPPTLDSCRRARAIVERAIAAHGGEEKLRGLSRVAVTVDAEVRAIGQSPDPDGPEAVVPWRQRTIADVAGGRFVQEQDLNFPGDFHYRARRVVTPESGFTIDVSLNWDGPVPDRTAPADLGPARATLAREIPPLLLLAALDHASTLRIAEGSPDSVVFADDDGEQVTLSFDSKSGRLRGRETLSDSGLLGDQVFATEYLYDPPAKDGILWPSRIKQSRAGRPWIEARVFVENGADLPESLFQLPAGFADAQLTPENALRVRKLGDGVWAVQRLAPGYPDGRTLFVEFSDYVLVVEAPFGAGATEAALKEIEKTVPGKPVRYVAFTHPHTDHAAGLRPYIARGVTIVTTPGNRGYVERLAAAPHTIRPDALARHPRPPKIETYQGERVFDDGKQRVELHDVGPNNHVRELVLAYLPRQKLVYQGDMLILPNFGTEVPRGNALTHLLRDWLTSHAPDVETIAGSHGRVGTRAELERAAR